MESVKANKSEPKAMNKDLHNLSGVSASKVGGRSPDKEQAPPADGAPEVGSMAYV